MASSNSATEPMPDDRFPRHLGLGLVVLSMLSLSWWLGSVQRETLFDNLELKGRQQLDLYVSHLSGQLGRYAFLPALLADDKRLHALLASPEDTTRQKVVNLFLGHVNAIAGSLDVYLMKTDGVTVAASNWQDKRTFVGRNFSFRPYFIDAMQGRAGRYYALGTTSGRRGYYFSFPVTVADAVAGVIVVKVDIDTLENNWRGDETELVVSDPDGVIFVSTRPDWRYRTLQPLGADIISRIRASRRYLDAPLTSVFYRARERRPTGAQILQLAQPDGSSYLELATDMPEAGWRVHLLVSQRVASSQVWQTRLFALSLQMLLATAVWGVLAGNRRRKERESEKRAAMEHALLELERRVERRTADLTETNQLLRDEVEKHERTRDELIQSAKLAALGQMSAGINHELNQPLTAMRTYAENARAYLAQQKLDQVGWNLQQISELTNRMAQISGQLKVFSRKASGQLIRVSLRACVDGMRRIVRTRLSRCGAELVIDIPDEDLFVAADMIQLEQVLVNLVGNACDALFDRPFKRIQVIAEQDGAQVRIRVQDSGPGIDEGNQQRIFDPFFTTTESGLGLGLSISHTIVQRLGGSLTAGNAHQGGAVFTINLVAWDDAPPVSNE